MDYYFFVSKNNMVYFYSMISGNFERKVPFEELKDLFVTEFQSEILTQNFLNPNDFD